MKWLVEVQTDNTM